MAVYEALLLNTVVPQIQAAQAGDSYVMVVNATTPALRITQTGTGDSILVEDAANPDSSPFVVTAAGDVGIGTSSPGAKLQVAWSLDQLKFTNPSAGFKQIGASYTGYVSGNDYSAIILGTDGSSGGKIQFSVTPSSGSLTTAATLDQNGNLGLGVTPSAWDRPAFQTTQQASFFGLVNTTNVVQNAFFNASWKYTTTAPAAILQVTQGAFNWFTAPSGTAGNAITFTQAMTLDASGNLGVGATSPSTFNQNQLYGAVIGNGTSLPGLTLYGGTASGGSLNFADGTSGTDQYRGSVEYNHGSDFMAFRTASTERARITSGGDLQIANGNLVMSTSGKGIDFAATAGPTNGTMTSELLNDYEEGTWTPVVSGSTSAGSGTYTQQFGAYTKIGNMVYWRMFVGWTAHTGTGNTLLSGLPFTSNATRATPAVAWFSGFTFTENPFLYVNNNSTSIDAIQMNSGTNASAIAIAGSASIYAAGCYQV